MFGEHSTTTFSYATNMLLVSSKQNYCFLNHQDCDNDFTYILQSDSQLKHILSFYTTIKVWMEIIFLSE